MVVERPPCDVKSTGNSFARDFGVPLLIKSIEACSYPVVTGKFDHRFDIQTVYGGVGVDRFSASLFTAADSSSAAPTKGFRMKEISLIAFEGFTDIDLFLMWDILGRNTKDWRVKILGSTPVLRSAHGLEIQTQGHLSEAINADVVVFSSGKEGVPAALSDPNFLPSIDLDPARQIVGSICAGAFFLDRLGLLPERRATTHPDARGVLVDLGLTPVDQPLVCHRNIATAGGCLAALYLTGWIIESLFDTNKRNETLLPVLPAGQREVYEALVEFSIRQGHMNIAPGISNH